ncbi:MAG: TRAP transporter substrate-binding protein [Rhodobiaceae bacterium]|nr:TRAP transporter substrate-binding protein [Rhodobiaceae bacterium]MCC0015676.1 TRAP transporter substrate-binding protein [Rhodobiaceae bacterium]MCC0042218.1 TRAP transporter substrate-binding protein [Rhodobiaceae bacterium]
MLKICFKAALAGAALAGALAAGAAQSMAQDVTLRVHHFLPPPSTTHAKVFVPWAEKVEKESGGRIKVELYPSMQLGGKPPQLLDQVRDGLADIVWALPGYTPGRYPKMSVFELPFMVSTATATSQAIQEYYEQNATDEWQDVKVLWFHTHARGVIHTISKPVEKAADVAGLKLRAPNREIGGALGELGASPVFMPVPALPEALSKGVVDGAVIPWEIVPALKLYQLTKHHAETPGPRGMYTAVFVFAMNKAKYDSLPDDLKKVIDDNSGLAMARWTGELWDAAEEPGRKLAADAGNTIVELPEAEVAIIREKTQPITDAWIASMGDNGKALYDAANALLDKYAE